MRLSCIADLHPVPGGSDQQLGRSLTGSANAAEVQCVLDLPMAQKFNVFSTQAIRDEPWRRWHICKLQYMIKKWYEIEKAHIMRPLN